MTELDELIKNSPLLPDGNPKYILANRDEVMRLAKECLDKHEDIIEKLSKR